MKKTFTKFISVFLCVIMLASVFMTAGFAASDSWIDESLLYTDRYLTSASKYSLASGLVERDIVLNNKASSNQIKGYVMEVDMSNPDISIVACYNDADLDGYGMATVRSQAAAYESKYGAHVIGAVNGSGYSTSTGVVTGLLVMNGVLGHEADDKYHRPFFAILNDGTAVIRPSTGDTSDVKEAVSGMTILVVDGEALSFSSDTKTHPRTAVGIKADGSIVFFVADGRQSPESCGMVYDDLAATMLAMGCVDAMALDGGGSSTMLTERAGTDELEVVNTPCYGYEREVGATLLICTTAEATGEFDYVAFSEPEYKVAPRSYFSFDYWGVDTNGFGIDLPENGYVEVADETYGSIKGSKFYANGTQGTTTLNYVVDGEVIGSATIVVTNEADSVITIFFKEIKQMISNFFNLFQFFLEKIGLAS